MMELALWVEAFHFIRPAVLLVLPVILAFWWAVRSRVRRKETRTSALAPHLQKALTLGEDGRRWFLPIDGVALVLLCTGLAAAGPTWSRMPDPFVAPTAPVVVVLKNTPSMLNDDVSPTRLDLARFKIRDLLERRAGGRTALVTYAGTAHRVVPFTEDAQIIVPYLDGLTPEIMPQEGSNALAALDLAQTLLDTQETPGGILFVLDELDPQDAAGIMDAGPHTVVFHQITPDGTGSSGINGAPGAAIIPLTADDADVRQIDRTLNAAYRAALLEEGTQPWQDRGWILALPAALLCLIWFRRGWTMKWAVFLAFMAVASTGPQRATAEGVADWFLTPDQQGQRAYNQQDFARAATLFTDPMWQGYALFRSGQYDKAVEVLARVETAEAAFTQGVAHLRNRQYRAGVQAFETALERDPDMTAAAENLATAREIVTYIEDTRAQSDTGEEAGIGADDTVFDNESGQGQETQIQASDAPALLTTEQWMTTVDTRTGDFLRQRFLIDAARGAP